MKFKEFNPNNAASAVYEIFGEDRFLCHLALEKIKSAFAPNLPDININTFSGENLDFKALDADLKVFPLGDKYRVIIVEDLKTKKNAKLDIGFFENYAQTQDFAGVLVVYNAGDISSLKIKNAISVDCSKLETSELMPMIVEFAQNNGKTISGAVGAKLCEYCAHDLTKIYSELEKLCSADNNKEITGEMVESLVTKTIDYQVFEITAKIAAKDKAGAMLVLKSLIKTEKSLYTILGMLYNTYRRALFASINKDKTDSELASLLGVKEYAIKMLKNQTKIFSPRKLKQIVDNLAALDANIKQGKIKDDIGLEVAVIEILNMI